MINSGGHVIDVPAAYLYPDSAVKSLKHTLLLSAVDFCLMKWYYDDDRTKHEERKACYPSLYLPAMPYRFDRMKTISPMRPEHRKNGRIYTENRTRVTQR